MSTSMFKRTVTLIEVRQGWLWAERGTTFKTLVNAKRAVSREDKQLAKLHGGCMTTLVQKPTTNSGTLLVHALA